MPCHHCRKARSSAREAIKAALDKDMAKATAKAAEAVKAIGDKLKGEADGDNR